MPTPEEYRDQLIAQLREEQRGAQQRVAQAKEQGIAPEPFDRDVAGWLADGLCDLLADKITGESFLRPGRGIICLLYTSPSPRDGLLSRMPSSA